jgi:hypothetical protein
MPDLPIDDASSRITQQAYDNGYGQSFTASGPALFQVVCRTCGCVVEAYYWRMHRERCADDLLTGNHPAPHAGRTVPLDAEESDPDVVSDSAAIGIHIHKKKTGQ